MTTAPSPKRSKPWRTAGGIRIRPLRNQSGSCSYRVEIPESITGTRVLRQFKTPGEAESYAELMLVQRANNGLASFSFTDRQRVDAKRAFELLEGAKDASLVEAVTFYLRHHCPIGGDITIDALREKYLSEKTAENLRPRSIADLRHRLTTFSATFGHDLVKNISSERIKEWLIDDPARSNQTKLNYKRVLHGFFTYAVKNKFCVDNPLAQIDVRVDTTEPVILTVDQARCLLHASLEHAELGLSGYLTLGFFCGIRSEELCRLDWADVNVSEGFVTISKRIAKKRRVRNVPLEPNAIDWLSVMDHPHSGLIAPIGAAKRMRKLIVLAKQLADKATPPIRWFAAWPNNGLRHSFASYFFAKTSNAAETCARLGQRSDDVLFQHYRSLVKKVDAERFFELRPPAEHNRCLVLTTRSQPQRELA